MASTGLVLAVDLGSSGVKVAVVDDTGAVRAVVGEPLATRLSSDGGAEQDPAQWWQAIGRCSRRAVAAAGVPGSDIGVVAVTSQYNSTVAVDATGQAVAPAVMWMDTRTAAHHPFAARSADEQQRLARRWVERHGLPPGGGDVLGQMAFVRDRWPAAWAAAAALVQPVDHLLARLTGVVAASPNSAFPLLLVDNRRWGTAVYDDEALAEVGDLATRLPALRPFGEPRGAVTPVAAEHLGIAAGAVAVAGTIDTATSAIGAGAVAESSCGVVIGTTAVVLAHLDAMRTDLAHAISAAPSPVPGRYAVIAENGIGGKALDVAVNQLLGGEAHGSPERRFDEALAEAASSPPGSGGVVFAPWLVGAMAPRFDHHQRGAYLGLGLGSQRADLLRAVLEGVALNLARLVPHVRALAGPASTAVRFGGGGAASPLWGQILADVLGVQVHRLADARATNCRGAALVALAETGRVPWDALPHLVQVAEVHEPQPTAQRTYAPLVELLDEYQALTAPFVRRLSRLGRSTPPAIDPSRENPSP